MPERVKLQRTRPLNTVGRNPWLGIVSKASAVITGFATAFGASAALKYVGTVSILRQERADQMPGQFTGAERAGSSSCANVAHLDARVPESFVLNAERPK